MESLLQLCHNCAAEARSPYPDDYPPWQTVYYYFRMWCIDGTREKINTAEKPRTVERRKEQPSAAILDSQSVKTAVIRRPRVLIPKKDQRSQAPSVSRYN